MKDKDRLMMNTLRVLSADAVDRANSGHPGMPLGAAPMAFALWDKVLSHNPDDPTWMNRDRFILSAGHGSALLYGLLYLFDYGMTMEDLKQFRQLDSKTPGHPEYGHTVGVEATTGPLGQGLSMAVGMAMAEKHLAARYNKEGFPVIDHYTYVLAGDGDLMEGITNEASSLAGTLGLNKLIVLYDSNNITIEGDTSLAFREDVEKRYKALGWNVDRVEDGNDMDAVVAALKKAKKSADKPTLIRVITKIGYGSPKVGLASSHGEPLGAENTAVLRKNLQWTEAESFVLPPEVEEFRRTQRSRGRGKQDVWKEMYDNYEKAYPEEAGELQSALAGELPTDYMNSDEFYRFESSQATRGSSGEVLNRLAERIPQLFGGSADLAPSNKSVMKGRGFFSADTPEGSNVHYGVREHAMAAISNGIALHGGLIPYCATFLIFSDYLKPALRLSALMKQRVIYIFTHDSIGVGEDGPTHQPVDQLPMLRSIPGVVNFRPCDNKETAAAWAYALQHTDGPTTLSLTRQNTTDLAETGKGALKGAYVLKDFGEPELILMASGSEVKLIYEAAEELHNRGLGVRVVSVPSWEVFEAQGAEYKESVLPSSIRARLAVEASSPFGWERYTGLDGEILAMESFGASAPGKQLFERFGFTVSSVVEKALALCDKE
jgi:transketolase